MKNATTIGIDLAKSVFQVAGISDRHKVVYNKAMSRQKLCQHMAQHPRCVVGMEACGSAHYWAGVFTEMGHTVKLLPPAYVKGLVYGNKHDANDAKAIGLAAAQQDSPQVSIKTADQLSLQALMRIRERRVDQRINCANQLRGLLYEHGMTFRKVLHIALEQGLYNALAKIGKKENYLVGDLYPTRYRFANRCMKIELCQLEKQPSREYDFVIHLHVLEHTSCNIAYTLFHLRYNRIWCMGGN